MCFHVLLGAICTITPFALIVWFYFIFIFNFRKALKSLEANNYFFYLVFFFYLISFELLDRMAKTSPFLPYELGKYLFVIMGILGIFISKIKYSFGLVLVVLILPAVFYDNSGSVDFNDIVNTLFAPLSIGLVLAFIYKKKINEKELNSVLKVLWLTCLSSLVFTYLRTPDFDNISFSLKAQFDTTGGHSSNQVSTILGLGVFLSFYSIYKKIKFSGFFSLDIFIFTLFIFQSLLSFSRGGVLVALVGIIILSYRSILKQRLKGFLIAFSISIFIYIVFTITNNLTGGLLILRYQGETQATLNGTRDKSADILLSGRLGIFEEDIELWNRSPILGNGCGSSKYLRSHEEQYVAAHVELSRFMAEHGILGVLYFVLLIVQLILGISWTKDPEIRIILFAIFSIAILTTFHAAMRTYLTPALIILSSLSVSSGIKLTHEK